MQPAELTSQLCSPCSSVHTGTPCVTSERGASTGSRDPCLPGPLPPGAGWGALAGKRTADRPRRCSRVVQQPGWREGFPGRGQDTGLQGDMAPLQKARWSFQYFSPHSEQDGASTPSTALSSDRRCTSKLVPRRVLVEAAGISLGSSAVLSQALALGSAQALESSRPPWR